MLRRHLGGLSFWAVHWPIDPERTIVWASHVSGQGTAWSCEPSLQRQKNVLNSSDAALTSACDSVRELRLAVAGEADRVKMPEECVQVITKGMSWVKMSTFWGDAAFNIMLNGRGKKDVFKDGRPNKHKILWECDKLLFSGVIQTKDRWTGFYLDCTVLVLMTRRGLTSALINSPQCIGTEKGTVWTNIIQYIKSGNHL